jgi:ubiquinone/menaquinone biosynthesis C-methylase UbiE
MTERISLQDKTLFLGYANHIQRYMFASQYSAGQRVLDAGCGTGYGSVFLATRGASSVTAIDISDEALAEAKRLYQRDNLRFIKGDVERLSEIPDLGSPFDLVVNLENIEHLANPTHFLEEARRQLTTEGILVVSTPNGELTERDDAGRILNPFHVQEFTESAFQELLRPYFNRIELFGQWKTPERLARIHFEHSLFESLCELYYHPGHRLWRFVRRLLGMRCVAPPQYSAEGTSYPFDFTIQPMNTAVFPWSPDVILAVCRL